MKIRIYSPEHSAQVQKALFKMGYTWAYDSDSVSYTDKKFLLTSHQSKRIMHSDSEAHFNLDSRIEHFLVGNTLAAVNQLPASHLPIKATFEAYTDMDIKRLAKAKDMAMCLWEIMHNGPRFFKNSNYDPSPAWDYLADTLESFNILVDDLNE